MDKSKIAEKEIEVAQWLQKQGYDRRVYKEVAPIIVNYLTEFKLLDLHFVIKNEVAICPICNVTELVNGNCKTCTDELCKPARQIVL